MQQPLSDEALDELDAFDFDLSDDVRVSLFEALVRLQ